MPTGLSEAKGSVISSSVPTAARNIGKAAPVVELKAVALLRSS